MGAYPSIDAKLTDAQFDDAHRRFEQLEKDVARLNERVAYLENFPALPQKRLPSATAAPASSSPAKS